MLHVPYTSTKYLVHCKTLVLSVARWNRVLFGIVVARSQAALLPVVELFLSDQNACLE